MIVTEDEAKEIRCQESFGQFYVTRAGDETHQPFASSFAVQHSTYAHGSYAAITNGPQLPTVASPSHCIGSRCMAWRWSLLSIEQAWGKAPTGYCGKAKS